MPKNRSLALAMAALLLTACQAPASMSVEPAPTEPADAPLMIRVAEAGAAIPGLRELDALELQAPVGAPLALPIQYRSGMEERVSWEGTGSGVAELKNDHGQLIYRVKEGEAPKTVTVPAGHYTLTITPDANQSASPMLISAIPSETGTGLSRELVDVAEGAGGDRNAFPVVCTGITHTLQRMGDLERAIQFRRQKAHFFPEYDKLSRYEAYREYLNVRSDLNQIYFHQWSQMSQEGCAKEMDRHKPESQPFEKTPLLFPYLYTYYMRTFKK